MFFNSQEDMLSQIRAKLDELRADPEISANFVAMREAANEIAKRCHYSKSLAGQCAMAMKVNVSEGNEQVAAEMMASGVELAKMLADAIGAGPEAVLEACRQMEFSI